MMPTIPRRLILDRGSRSRYRQYGLRVVRPDRGPRRAFSKSPRLKSAGCRQRKRFEAEKVAATRRRAAAFGKITDCCKG